MHRLVHRGLMIGVVTGVLAGAMTSPVAAAQPDQPISEAVFFGDSLTDAGTYGVRFTTVPGQTWAQHVAARLGQSTEPNEHVDNYSDVYQGIPGAPGPGGLNYAEGGARASLPYSVVSDNPEGTPISTEVQLQRYLAQHGTFEPNQLVTLWVGTNDVALKFDSRFDPELAEALRANQPPGPDVMAAERLRVQQAASAEARTAAQIVANGGQHVLVFKLFDLGLLPWFETQAARDYVNDLTAAYNATLLNELPGDPRVQVLDMQAFISEVLADPGRYGFRYGANEDACAQPGQDYCAADAWKAPDADRTYVFAASEHLTTHAHEVLADYVLRQVGLTSDGG